jgi:hypothetical protein
MEEILIQLNNFKSKIPVNPGRPITTYIDIARQLKLRGVQFYKKECYSDAYVNLGTYEQLITEIRGHPDARTQPHRKNVFSLVHDLAVVKGLVSEAEKRILESYQVEE